MKRFITMTAAAALAASTAIAGGSLSADGKTEAEINFGSTHPGTETATGQVEQRTTAEIGQKGEPANLNNETETVDQTRVTTPSGGVGEVQEQLDAENPWVDTTDEAEKKADFEQPKPAG